MAFRSLTNAALFAIIFLAGCSAPKEPSEVSLLFVQHAQRGVASQDGAGMLVQLTGATNLTTWFTDRPYRAGGVMPTSDFVTHWQDGKDRFATDPPNGALVLHGENGVAKTFAVEFLDIRYDSLDATLTYHVRSLPESQDFLEDRHHDLRPASELPTSFSDVAVFIDSAHAPAPTHVCQYDSICV